MSHVPIASFDARYRASHDPWDFQTSPYERRRYEITVASLPRRHYERAFEPACSIGELSALLAPRCGELLALDASPTAVRTARNRLARLPQVHVAEGELPGAWPEAQFDLIVFSELGYYFPVDELDVLIRKCQASLTPEGHLVAVHWRGTSADHLLGGDAVHERFARVFGVPEVRHEETQFRLELWEGRR